MKLGGKTVLITGASEGIGAACAAAFRNKGANISLIARSREKLEMAGGEGAVITAGDLTDPEVRQRAVAATVERFGGVDVLVNNAGIGLYSPSWKAEESDVRQMIELNLFVPMAMTRLAVPHMIERQSGIVVNVGSIAGPMTLPWMTIYSATKAALGSLSDGLRLELKDKGIKAITVNPGYVSTGFHNHLISGHVPEAIQKSRKFAITAEQCADAIVRGVEKESRTVHTPGVGRLIVAFARLFPSVVDWQLHRMYRSAVDG